MASETLRLTAQIVISHASTAKLTTKELVAEIKPIYYMLVSLETEVEVSETKTQVARKPKTRTVKVKESPIAKAIQDNEGPEVGDPDYMEFMESREG